MLTIDDGTRDLAEIVVPEGETVEVGTVLCHLVTEESELGAAPAAAPANAGGK